MYIPVWFQASLQPGLGACPRAELTSKYMDIPPASICATRMYAHSDIHSHTAELQTGAVPHTNLYTHSSEYIQLSFLGLLAAELPALVGLFPFEMVA